jgi:hypothetical protein
MTREDIEAFIEALQDSGLTPNTVRTRLWERGQKEVKSSIDPCKIIGKIQNKKHHH